MMIRSRSRLTPASSSVGMSRVAAAPGPPVMKTIGSGGGDSDAAGMIATGNRIVRPYGVERLSGTTRNPHCAVCRAGIGSGVIGQVPGSNRAVDPASAGCAPLQSVDATSVVSHAVCTLSKTVLARRYLTIMSSALAVQTKGFGLLL